MTIRLRVLAHYVCGSTHYPVGQELELPPGRAAFLLADSPGSFEVVPKAAPVVPNAAPVVGLYDEVARLEAAALAAALSVDLPPDKALSRRKAGKK